MITQKTEKKSVVSLVLVSSLLLLTGCFGEKANKGQESQNVAESAVGKGELLLSIDGKPVLYSQDFEDQKQMLQQSNQQLNMILQMMPDAAYTMLFKSIEAGLLIKEWAIRAGVEEKDDFAKRRRLAHEQIDLNLYMQEFMEAHPIEVSDHEALNFYKEKRDQIQGLVTSPASVEVVYASCKTKAQAEDFASKARDGSEKHMKTAAKDMNLKLESMTISPDSACDNTLKQTALVATKFPAKEIVKINDNVYYVVGLLKKNEAQYHSFDNPQVKEFMKKSCKDAKREAELAQEIDKLRSKYNVVENKEYFEAKTQNQAKALQRAEELVMQAQQAAGQELDDAMLDDKI
jgi:hypothetical protein